MRLTIEIEPKLLKAIMTITGETKKSPAVGLALREFVRRKKLEHFSELILKGEFDFPLTNEEIEEADR